MSLGRAAGDGEKKNKPQMNTDERRYERGKAAHLQGDIRKIRELFSSASICVHLRLNCRFWE